MDSQEDSQPSQSSVMTLTDEDRHEVLYFAYGSNLSTVQMRQRCPLSTPIGLGYLEGWRWIINARGFANIVPLPQRDASSTDQTGSLPGTSASGDESGGVWGLLYLLPPRDEEQLDVHEGVPWAYQKVQADLRWVFDDEKRRVDEVVRALIYIDGGNVTEDKPRAEYIQRMERGIQDAVDNWGMSDEYANRTMKRFWSY